MRVNPRHGTHTFRAKWVMVTPEHILENGYLQATGGTVVRVDRGSPTEGGTVTDLGDGLLMPAPINVHTHLELSSPAFDTTLGRGLIPWVFSLISRRVGMTDDQMEESRRLGIERMEATGTALVGDVCNLRQTIAAVAKASFSSWSFLEFLGSSTPEELSELHPLQENEKGTHHGFAIAGHAPHTLGAETLTKLKAVSREHGLPFSLHLAESPEEAEYIATGKGAWAQFLSSRNFKLPIPHSGLSPVEYADTLGVLDSSTIAVHLTFAGHDDLEILAGRGAQVCVCPRSNEAITGHLPPIDAMIAAGLTPCLGTDSLASSPSLDIFDEMAFVARHYPTLSPREITAMVTANGARALQAGDLFGDLTPGHAAVAVFLPIMTQKIDDLLERLVHGEGRGGGPAGEW